MANWTLNKDAGAFIPNVGECYEISFGNDVMHDGKRGKWLFEVRCDDSLNKAKWIELNTGLPLDAALQARVVLAWRSIPCRDCP